MHSTRKYMVDHSVSIQTMQHKHIFKRRTKSPRMSRWSVELAKYNYTIHNKQGKNNYVSDTLNKSIAAVDIENQNE